MEACCRDHGKTQEHGSVVGKGKSHSSTCPWRMDCEDLAASALIRVRCDHVFVQRSLAHSLLRTLVRVRCDHVFVHSCLTREREKRGGQYVHLMCSEG